MRLLRGLAAELVARAPARRCSGSASGHELLAAELGLEIVRKDVPVPGRAERIDLFGRPETVGFYNTFTARCDDATALPELADAPASS